ncbi:MAG TPA: YciI family protein [Terriglobales bacterium]|nr:YciI family protein [Terriglobales bacterium]
MQFLLLIYHPEAEWVQTENSSKEAIYREYRALAQQLSQAGKLVAGDQLKASATAAIVRVRNGKAATIDGPFVETKEQLGGYFLINADDLADAISIAARIPSARTGAVEVREVITRQQV